MMGVAASLLVVSIVVTIAIGWGIGIGKTIASVFSGGHGEPYITFILPDGEWYIASQRRFEDIDVVHGTLHPVGGDTYAVRAINIDEEEIVGVVDPNEVADWFDDANAGDSD